jgi:hypothetical protein
MKFDSHHQNNTLKKVISPNDIRENRLLSEAQLEINTLSGRSVEFFNVKPVGMHDYHCPLKNYEITYIGL